MIQRRFSFEMQTLLGRRNGELSFTEADGKITGLLDLLHHLNSVTGSLSDDGRLEFDGSIITVIRAIPFHADGKITDGRLTMMLRSDNCNFRAVGTEIK